MSSREVNSFDGPIVQWTKRTLRDFPQFSVKLYMALIWRNIISFFFVFIIIVCAVRGILYVVHAFDFFPLVFMAIGVWFLLSAAVTSLLAGGALNSQSRPSDADLKETSDAVIGLSYSIQRYWEGVDQHRRMHETQFTFELMIVGIVLGIVLPMVSFDAIVWLCVLALLILPGIYHSWFVSQSAPPAQAPAPDQPPQDNAPPRRNVPRYSSSTAPVGLVEQVKQHRHHH